MTERYSGKVSRESADKEPVSADYTDSPGQADTLFRKNPCRYDAVFFSVAPESGNPSAAAETAEKMQKLNPYLQIILMTTYDYLPLSILECGNIRLLKKPLELPRLSRLVSDLRKNAAALAAGGQKLLVLKFTGNIPISLQNLLSMCTSAETGSSSLQRTVSGFTAAGWMILKSS